jgi:hypothetical protein
MTKAYDNSLLARNINISGVNTNVSGVLQVNGVNVSLNGHAHTSSNITDFNSSVSGLLPVTNIVSGSGISISSSGGSFTINSTSSAGNQIVSYATTASFPETGSTSSYYLASDTSRLYQWTGSYYAEIGPPISSVNNAQNAANLYMWSNFK